VAIDALRKLSGTSCELKIFGDPEVFPDYTRDLRTRAERLPVRFMGRFERARVADVYAQMDVLVVPSLWLENSPLVIHEAFMAGVPVVGSRIGGIADLVRDGRNGLLFEPGNATDLAAAIRRLATDRSLLRELAAQAPSVKPIEVDAHEWEAEYEQVIDESRAADRIA
jgi:glycosyltransferase involved in cell wall biosynthesis